MKIKKILITSLVLILLIIPMIFAFPSFISFESDKTTTTTTAILSVTAMDLDGMNKIKIYEDGNKILELPCGSSTVCTHPYIPVVRSTQGTFDYYAKAINMNGEVAKSQTISIEFLGRDNFPPIYSNINPVSPYTIVYDQQPFDLSVDWTDDTAIDTVTIKGDFYGSITQLGDTYTYTVNNQNVGKYNWYMTATDIDGRQTSTPQQILIITKADPALHLFLNANENDITVPRNSLVDVQGTTIAPGNLEIKENNIQIALGPSPLDVLGRLYDVKDVFTIDLIYAATQNYNAAQVSYQITVVDAYPTVTLLTPADDSIISDLSGNVAFTYTASDDIQVASCQLIFDGNPKQIDNTPPFDTFSLTGVSQGPHSWNIECTDDIGQKAQASSDFTFTIQNDAPDITNIQPVTPYTVYTINNVNFQIDVSDTEGTNLDVEWFVDGISQATGNYPSGSTVPFSYLFDTEKTYTVRVEVIDQDLQSSFYQWTVDSIQIALTGTVTDGNGVLSGVTIDVEELGVPVDSTTTLSDGTYSIVDLDPATYDVTATLAGYYPVTKQIILNNDGVLNFFLAPDWCTDADGDGVYVDGGLCGAVDCDDTDDEVYPGASEKCNNIDDNCDGTIDSITRSCGIDVGACRCGTQTCTAGSWGTCDGAIGPQPESCDDNIDNDCDGEVNEGCPQVIYLPNTVLMEKDEIIKLIFPDTSKYQATLKILTNNYILLSILSPDLDLFNVIINYDDPTLLDMDNDLIVTYNGIENNKASITFELPQVEEDDGFEEKDRSSTTSATSIIEYVKEEVQELPEKVKEITGSTITFIRNQKKDARHAAAVAIFLLMLAVIVHFTKRHWDNWI